MFILPELGPEITAKGGLFSSGISVLPVFPLLPLLPEEEGVSVVVDSSFSSVELLLEDDELDELLDELLEADEEELEDDASAFAL